MRIALRVEARTARGLRHGMPNLMRLLNTFGVRASFFFPVGRDLSGRQPLRTWRDRSRVGFGALAYGTLLPGPDLLPDARRVAAIAARDGHHVGLLGLAPVQWSQRLAYADPDWVDRQLGDVQARGEALAGPVPLALATPDWQTHPRLIGAMVSTPFGFTSMTRGKLPYLPLLQGERSSLPEVPTTLPTVDELLAVRGVDAGNVHEYLYAESRRVLPAGHVFAVSAEREGIDRLDLIEKLLVMWKGQGGTVRALDDVLGEIDTATLPRHQVGWATPPGAVRAMATQSVEAPA